jgi:hypothetical protein
MLTSCAVAEHIEGYPVYKFVDLGDISERTLTELKKAELTTSTTSKEPLGRLITEYEQMLQTGLKDHHAIKLITSNGDETMIFVPQSVYTRLWEKSPHDLAKEHKTHSLSIDVDTVRIGTTQYKQAINTAITLVDKEPVLRK